VHELALEGDEDLQVGDHVAFVNDGVSIVAVVTAIDDSGYIHLALRGRRRDPDLSRATHAAFAWKRFGSVTTMRQVFDRGEFNALFVDMDAPTNDDVSITTDGRRLDSVEAVLDLVEEAERERATAERVTVVDANARPNPRPEYCWRVQQRAG
jgi:hypothetical protein